MAFKHMWSMDRGTFSKKGVYFLPFQKIILSNLNIFQAPYSRYQLLVLKW